jgi:hypothetical protein
MNQIDVGDLPHMEEDSPILIQLQRVSLEQAKRIALVHEKELVWAPFQYQARELADELNVKYTNAMSVGPLKQGESALLAFRRTHSQSEREWYRIAWVTP